MKSPPVLSTHNLAAKSVQSAVTTPTPTATSQVRGHGHSHSHGHSHGGHRHAHSHGSIEENISGKLLRQCQIATLAGGTTNVFFCVTKLWIGSAGGSVALVADGFHALTDILADIISYSAVSLSRKKFPRCRFPFGIGRLETSGAVLVAAILFFGGVALLVQSVDQCVLDVSRLLATVFPAGGMAASLMPILGSATADAPPSSASASPVSAGGSHGHSHGGDGHHGHSHFEVTQFDEATGKQVILWTMVCIAAASVVAKELLFRWTRRVGLRAGSRVVVANAYHHRVDAWSSGVALIGVAGQVVGIPGIDGLAGLAVSISICKVGYGLFRDAVLEFFDFQNAEEVSSVRAQLRDFSLRIEHGKRVVQAQAGTRANEAAAASPETSQASLSTSSVATSDDPDAVDRKKILFMNVFLVRHGHKYALHVTLLVFESVVATQICEAVDMLTALARGSLHVQDTFTTILVCSNHTETRESYLGRRASQGDEGDRTKPGTAAAAEVHTQQSPAHSKVKDGDGVGTLHTAATGNVVSPSLERCIASLEEFHAFSSRIRYNWEERTITAPSSNSCECDRDIASVAEMFRCQLISESAACEGGAAEAEACTPQHSHDEHTHDSHEAQK